MKRPANAVRLACGHPMCDPGSPECRARDEPAVTSQEKLLADLQGLMVGMTAEVADLLDQLVEDVRADLAHAIATARPLATEELITRHWRRTRPGFARLLDLTDQD